MSKKEEKDDEKKGKSGILGRFYKSVRRVLEPRGGARSSHHDPPNLQETANVNLTRSAPSNIDRIEQQVSLQEVRANLTLLAVSTLQSQNEGTLERRASIRLLPAHDMFQEDSRFADSDSIAGSVASMPIIGVNGRRYGTVNRPKGPLIYRRPSKLPDHGSLRKRITINCGSPVNQRISSEPAISSNRSNSTSLAPIADFEESFEDTTALSSRSQSVRELEKAEVPAAERLWESQISASDPYLPSPILEQSPVMPFPLAAAAAAAAAAQEMSAREAPTQNTNTAPPRLYSTSSLPNLAEDAGQRCINRRRRGANSETDSGHGSVHHLVLNSQNGSGQDNNLSEQSEQLRSQPPNHQRRPSRTQLPDNTSLLFHTP